MCIQALDNLKKETKDLPGAPLDEDMLKWFLRDRDFDVAEAASKLRKATKWREKMRPDALSEDDVYVQLSTGKGYVHTHLDKLGRPVLVVRVARHFAGPLPLSVINHVEDAVISFPSRSMSSQVPPATCIGGSNGIDY